MCKRKRKCTCKSNSNCWWLLRDRGEGSMFRRLTKGCCPHKNKGRVWGFQVADDCGALILPLQVLRGAKLEVDFRILARSSPLDSELVLERRTREFHCVVFIFGDGELRVLHQSDELDVEVFKTFQRVQQITCGVGAPCESSSVGLCTRMLHAGTQFPNNGMSMPTVGDTVSGQSRRLPACAY